MATFTIPRTNKLYQKMVEILSENLSSVYDLVAYWEENRVFRDDTFLNEPYDGILYKIPLAEWNEKTGMQIVLPADPQDMDLPVLNDLITTPYNGTMQITHDAFVCIYGTC